MLGYLFMKRIEGEASPEPSLVLQEEANGWLALVESDDAIEEQEARRVAAEDLITECRLFFPGALVRKAGLVTFDTSFHADAAAQFVEKTWGVRPELCREKQRTWSLGWPLALQQHVFVGTSLHAGEWVSN